MPTQIHQTVSTLPMLLLHHTYVYKLFRLFWVYFFMLAYVFVFVLFIMCFWEIGMWLCFFGGFEDDEWVRIGFFFCFWNLLLKEQRVAEVSCLDCENKLFLNETERASLLTNHLCLLLISTFLLLVLESWVEDIFYYNFFYWSSYPWVNRKVLKVWCRCFVFLKLHRAGSVS